MNTVTKTLETLEDFEQSVYIDDEALFFLGLEFGQNSTLENEVELFQWIKNSESIDLRRAEILFYFIRGVWTRSNSSNSQSLNICLGILKQHPPITSVYSAALLALYPIGMKNGYAYSISIAELLKLELGVLKQASLHEGIQVLLENIP